MCFTVIQICHIIFFSIVGYSLQIGAMQWIQCLPPTTKLQHSFHSCCFSCDYCIRYQLIRLKAHQIHKSDPDAARFECSDFRRQNTFPFICQWFQRIFLIRLWKRQRMIYINLLKPNRFFSTFKQWTHLKWMITINILQWKNWYKLKLNRSVYFGKIIIKWNELMIFVATKPLWKI